METSKAVNRPSGIQDHMGLHKYITLSIIFNRTFKIMKLSFVKHNEFDIISVLYCYCNKAQFVPVEVVFNGPVTHIEHEG